MTSVNYRQLNSLYEMYAERGLEILAFPCTQFAGQEFCKKEQIMSFTQRKGVEFTMMETVDVTGTNTHQVFTFLKGDSGEITWNFGTKFLIGRRGHDVRRFDKMLPEDIENEIIEMLDASSTAAAGAAATAAATAATASSASASSSASSGGGGGGFSKSK